MSELNEVQREEVLKRAMRALGRMVDAQDAQAELRRRLEEIGKRRSSLEKELIELKISEGPLSTRLVEADAALAKAEAEVEWFRTAPADEIRALVMEE